jgi:hypothetical protein
VTPRNQFHPLQAQEIARAFQEHDVDYLFLGKSGAILLGYPGTTQDVDVFPRRSAENGRRIVNLRNIIASKRASGRQKDLVDLPLLESFRVEFEKRHAPPLRSAAETAADRPKTASASPKLSPEL